jgi:hypothetical protein
MPAACRSWLTCSKYCLPIALPTTSTPAVAAIVGFQGARHLVEVVLRGRHVTIQSIRSGLEFPRVRFGGLSHGDRVPYAQGLPWRW